MLKIIGSRTSPFVRTVRATCIELDLDIEFIDIGSFPEMSEEHKQLIHKNNPLMKIPVLIDEGQNVIDSRVIISYLRNKYEAQPVFENSFDSDIQEQNVLSVIYGIMDAGILRFIMDGLDMERGYMARSFQRIESGLKYLEEQKQLGSSFGICELTLICALEGLKKREPINWSAYKNLNEIHERLKDRPSFVQTRIPEKV